MGKALWPTFPLSFPNGWSIQDKVVVIGAGGAARAVLAALHEEGCRNLTILNRSAGSCGGGLSGSRD
jgi:shikimate 5-dehydrogenase